MDEIEITNILSDGVCLVKQYNILFMVCIGLMLTGTIEYNKFPTFFVMIGTIHLAKYELFNMVTPHMQYVWNVNILGFVPQLK